MSGAGPQWPLDLVDWRRRVFAMYREARSGEGSEVCLARFRGVKDILFASHPESPIPAEDRDRFGGLDHFPHRPDLRVSAVFEAAATAERIEIATSDGAAVALTVAGHVHPRIDGRTVTLAIYWFDTYGGGLFLPFRDQTSGAATYGGGRYLLDTVKGADLGVTGDGQLLLDFNYAYNPSCAYDPRWSCPLSPRFNDLPIPIEAGERRPR